MRWSRYGMQSKLPRLACLATARNGISTVINCVRLQGVLERCPNLVVLLLICRHDYSELRIKILLSYMPNTLSILQMHHCHMSIEVLLELGRALPHLQVFPSERSLYLWTVYMVP